MTAPRIVLDSVTCRHAGALAIEGVSGAFLPGLTAIAGANGAGKTTLLRAIAGLHPTAAGAIRFEAMSRADIALLPQSGGTDRRFPLTVRELVTLGAWTRTGPFRPAGPDEAARVEAALARVGLAGLGHRLIAALSAGQFQRVLFARLIVQDARAILLDEPFTGVDSATEADLMALMREWAAQRRIVVAVLHDTALIRAEFETAIVLRHRVLSWGPARALPALPEAA